MSNAGGQVETLKCEGCGATLSLERKWPPQPERVSWVMEHLSHERGVKSE